MVWGGICVPADTVPIIRPLPPCCIEGTCLRWRWGCGSFWAKWGPELTFRYLSTACLALSVFVGGCSIIPTSGPEPGDVRAGQTDVESLPYALVRLTPPVVNVLAANTPRLSSAFSDKRGPSELRFGI